MSKESAVAFIEKTSSDNSLHRRIAELGPNDSAGLVQIAASAGYALSVEDLKSVLSSTEDELSDGALGRVSGGLNPCPLPPKIGIGFLHINPGLLRNIRSR